MCYETSLTKTTRDITKAYDATMKVPMLYKPWYHMSGFVHPNLFCIPIENPEEIYPMEWGLIAPFGEKDIIKFRRKYNTLNAKAETLLTSNIYKDPTRKRRCLILADGFFEPHYPDNNFKGHAQPYYCYLEGRRLFTFAGVYNTYDSDYWSVSMITTEANEFFADVHNKTKRMPMVLDPEFEGEWLRPDLSDQGITDILKHGFIQDPFKAHPITRDLYRKDINTNVPRILEEFRE